MKQWYGTDEWALQMTTFFKKNNKKQQKPTITLVLLNYSVISDMLLVGGIWREYVLRDATERQLMHMYSAKHRCDLCHVYCKALWWLY